MMSRPATMNGIAINAPTSPATAKPRMSTIMTSAGCRSTAAFWTLGVTIEPSTCDRTP